MARAQQELAEFVISRAFNPVMRAKSEGKSDAERRTLEHVKQATQAEIERYRRYGSAQAVANNFKRDLKSPAAKKVHARCGISICRQLKTLRTNSTRRLKSSG